MPAWWQVPQLILDAAPEVWVLGHPRMGKGYRNLYIRNLRVLQQTGRGRVVIIVQGVLPALFGYGTISVVILGTGSKQGHVVNHHNMTDIPVFFMVQHVEEIGDETNQTRPFTASQ